MLTFVSMTFSRTVLFDEKKEDPAFAGLTAVGGVAAFGHLALQRLRGHGARGGNSPQRG